MSSQTEIFTIPDKKGPLVVGSRGANIKRIKEESGARIIVDMNPPTHTAKIVGTNSQRACAKQMIRELISKSRIIPTIGYTILGLDDTFNLREAKFQFVKFEGEDSNAHSQKMDKYYVERVEEPDKPDDKHDDDGIDDLANQLRHGLTLPSPTGGFVTWDKFGECLEAISEQLSKADPTNSGRKEIRLNIFLGRELFTKIEDKNKTFDAHDWSAFKRDSEIGSSFQHNSPQIVENISLIQEKFGLKLRKETLDGDKGSISIHNDQKEKRVKLKLHWFGEEGLWKITRAAKDIRREGIVDLISGTNMPDMRFLLKSQYDLRISDEDRRIVADMQSKPLVMRDGLWYRINDFDGKRDCSGIRQTVRKRVYANDKFQVTLQSVRNEFKVFKSQETQISTEETITVKNLSWRAVENIDKSTRLHFDEEELGATIRETIEFGREIARIGKD